MDNLNSLNNTSQPVLRPAGAPVSGQSNSPELQTSGNTLPPKPSSQPVAEPPSREEIEASIAQLRELSQSVQRDLSFSVDDITGQTVLTVIDQRTDEVIRQIPSEELIELAKNLQDLQEKLEVSKGNLLEVRV